MSGVPFFAWVDDIAEEPFDPAVHARRDMTIMRLERSQEEKGTPAATITVKCPIGGDPAGDHTDCHISTTVDGEIKWIFSGTIVRSAIARVGDTIEIEFHGYDEDEDAHRRTILAGVRRTQRYVEELASPSDDLDEDAILSHTAALIEYDLKGTPFLASMFGDPAKLRVLHGNGQGQILSVNPSVGGIPCKGAQVTLDLTWNQRKPIQVSLGTKVQEAIDEKATFDHFLPSAAEFIKPVQDGSTRPDGFLGGILYQVFIVVESGAGVLSASRSEPFDNIADAEALFESYDAAPGFTYRPDLSKVTAYGSEPTANWTLTPDVIESWPKEGATIGQDFVVLQSALVPVDGPGKKKESRSSGVDETATYGLKVDQLSSKSAGLPENPADYNGLYTATDVDGTVFSTPVLEVFGILTQQRRERFLIYVPNGGQEMRRGGGEAKRISLNASDLTDDKTTPEFESDHDYVALTTVQAQGVNWLNQLTYHSGSSGLLQDLVINDITSPFYQARMWYPSEENASPFGRPDVERSLDTVFGQRCFTYAAARAANLVAWDQRQAGWDFVCEIDAVWDLDMSATVRLVDRSIKGGSAEGKLTALHLIWDGPSGDARAEGTIASACGSIERAPDDDDIDQGPDVGTGPGGGGDDGGPVEGDPYDHGIDPPVPLIDPHDIDWDAIESINFYDVDWYAADQDPDYDSSVEDWDKIFFDYDRNGIPDDEEDGGDDGDDGDGDGDGDGDLPTEGEAATASAGWARFDFSFPFYLPPEMDTLNVAKVDVKWLGYDQARAIASPGVPYPPDAINQVEYPYGFDVQDFLEGDVTTKIEVTVGNQTPGGDKLQVIGMTTSPFPGPKQVTL